MRRAMIPDKFFRRLSDIDIASDIVEHGFTLVVLDIDGTIKNRLRRKAPDDIYAWIGKCQNTGLELALLSNDRKNRHGSFSQDTGIMLVSAAHKPAVTGLAGILDTFGVRPEKAVVIGNNPFTDILCAHRLGTSGYLVRSIETTRNRNRQRRRSS